MHTTVHFCECKRAPDRNELRMNRRRIGIICISDMQRHNAVIRWATFTAISRSLDQHLPQLIEPEAMFRGERISGIRALMSHRHISLSSGANIVCCPRFSFYHARISLFSLSLCVSNFWQRELHVRFVRASEMAQLVFATLADDMATSPFRSIDANPIRCSKQKKLAVVAVHKHETWLRNRSRFYGNYY